VTPPESGRPDRYARPAAGPVRPFKLPEVRRARTEDGLEIRSMARGGVPLVSVALVLNAGEVRAAPGREGLAVLTGDSLQGGTRRRTGGALADALESLGSGLRVSTGWDAATITFTSLAERLDSVFALLAEVVREASFPGSEVERMRSQRLAAIRQRKMDPAAHADDALDREVFPAGHPFHRPLAGTEDSVAALGLDQVVAFAKDAYSPSGGGVALVGDLSADEVLELVHRHLGSWPTAAAGGLALPEAAPKEARAVRIVHRPGAVQSELRLGEPGPSRGHSDEVPLRVANAVLGGAFTSRLNMNLREKHGFTYGARSAFEARRSGGLFSVGTSVQTEVTAAALAEAIGELERFASAGPEPDELAKARDYLAGVFPLRMETTAQLASRLAELLIYGLPDDHHHRYRDKVRAVDVATARDAVARHLHPDRMSVVIVGDADRIVGPVEALGVGGVTVEGLP
jgi:zinc protease